MEQTPFETHVREKFDHGQEMSEMEESVFLALLNGPLAYQNEDEILAYAQVNPDATMTELLEYWDSITPDGLPPGMTEEDLMDDEDE